MFLLYFLADAFINAFGITQPTPAARRRAAFFILGLMLLVIAGVFAAGYVLHLALR